MKLRSYLFWPLQGTNHCGPNGPITLGPPNSSSAPEAPEWGAGSSHSTAFLGGLGFCCKLHLALCARGNCKGGAGRRWGSCLSESCTRNTSPQRMYYYPQNKDQNFKLKEILRDHYYNSLTYRQTLRPMYLNSLT